MKPYKLFLFFALILLILSIISWLIPQEGWHILGYNIHFLKYKSVSQPSEPKATNDTIFVVPVDSIIPDSTTLLSNTDSLIEVGNTTPQPKNIPIVRVNIEYDSINFWSSFYDIITYIDSTNKQTRILYYGDSQIENDRITSSLRKNLQSEFGGSGRGLVPITDIYNTANNFIMSVSDNWERISVVGNKKKNLDAGLICESYKISKKKSSMNGFESSFIKIKTIDSSKDGGYTLVRLFYQTTGNTSLEVVKDGKSVYSQKLVSTNNIQELKLNFGESPNVLELKLQTSSELVIYGLSMETPSGIQVDNIALRGKATPEFTRLDSARVKQMARLLHPSLVILHYGVNVVPNVTENYGFYKNLLSTDIQFLKQNLTDVPILLISASDMAHRIKAELTSYSNIPNVINAQKEAAFENGCAFWNLYKTMGGKGSMIEWVEKTPPWGNTDYVHFTPLGANEVGKLLSNRFIETIHKTKIEEPVADEHPF